MTRIDRLLFIVDVDGDKIPSTDFRLNYILNSRLSPKEIAFKIRDLAAKRKAERAELSLLNERCREDLKDE